MPFSSSQLERMNAGSSGKKEVPAINNAKGGEDGWMPNRGEERFFMFSKGR